MKAQQHNHLPVVLALAGVLFSLATTQRAGADSFIDASPMQIHRWSHTATLLPDGKVLVAGGWPTGNTNCELYDPANDTWTRTGSLNQYRAKATSVLLANGKVLIVGGGDNGGWPIASCEIYDPATGRWTRTGSLNNASGITGPSLTLLPSGKVLSSRGEIYDPAAGRWSQVDWAGTGTLLPDGMVFSGSKLYDPDTGISTPAGTPPHGGDQTLLHTGEVLVSSGFGPLSERTLTSVYDYKSGTWAPRGSMITGSAGSAVVPVLLPNGKVLVLTKDGYQLYDPITGTWRRGAAMRRSGSGPATLLLNGNVLIAGRSGAELYLPDYDEATPSLNLLHQSNQILSFSWRGVGTLEESADLTDWQAALSQKNPQIIPTSNVPMRFFRVRSSE